MRSIVAATLLTSLLACGARAESADPASDAPEHRVLAATPVEQASSYEHAIALWRSAEDINAWIGARFEYDGARALLLSETQRNQGKRMLVYGPQAFFMSPKGVCVDLSRFAVETLRIVDERARPAYLMIEFDPVSVAGNTLRRHWLASFEREGRRYFFADSKRPGFIAGPYASTGEFVAEYARYRGRRIVAFKELDSYERRSRTLADRQGRGIDR